MVSTSRFGVLLGATLAAMLVAGCDKFGGNKPDAEQKQALTGPVSGGRSSDGAATEAKPAVAATSEIDFGDDSGKFSKDGECDDKRFAGPGMTDTPLLESDVRHDATDCRAAWNQHRLTLASANSAGGSPAAGEDRIQWGDDSGDFSKDGECDDKRFTGPGMTNTPLLDSDIKHDASDCRAEFRKGRLQLAGG